MITVTRRLTLAQRPQLHALGITTRRVINFLSDNSAWLFRFFSITEIYQRKKNMLNIVEPPCVNTCVVSDRDRLLGSWCYDISLFLHSCRGILLPYNISITLKLKGHKEG